MERMDKYIFFIALYMIVSCLTITGCGNYATKHVPEDRVSDGEDRIVHGLSNKLATLEKRFDEMELKTKYRVVKADLSWEDAKKAAEEQGGRLVSINDDAEFAEIETLLSQTDLQLCWVGAYIEDGERWDQAKWLDGTSLQIDKWLPGEPSHSNYDGLDERYLQLWNHEDTGWRYNDAVNVLFDMYKGKGGYVIEFSE